MNRRNSLLVAGCAVALLGGACASTSTGNRLQVAPLDARETQTRFYEGTDAATAMKAGLDMLQDGDFTITRTDSALGLIVGTKRTVQSPSSATAHAATRRGFLRFMAGRLRTSTNGRRTTRPFRRRRR